MLDLIRQRAQGWFAWAIITAITIPFALWGVNQYFSGGQQISVAKVNGMEISQARLQQAYLQQRQRLQEMFGENFRPELFPEDRMKQQLLDELIRNQLIIQAAVESDMAISDTQLAQAISDIGAFQVDGQFSNEQYVQVLRNNGMSPSRFENELRRDLISQQYYLGFADSGFVTDAQVDAYLKLDKQYRDVGYILIPQQRFKEQVEVSDEEIADYYDENQEQFRVPEQIQVNYLEISTENLSAQAEVGEEELKQRYESQKLNFRTEEQRKARHILIEVAEDAGDEAVSEARDKVAEIQSRLNAGESFADLAKEYSDDPGSANQGGDLGFFGRGVMDEAFEEAAFALKKGEVSEPVRSSFGIHLIKLEDVRGGETKPYEEVADKLLTEIRNEKAREKFYDLADQLGNLTYEHPDTLDLAAEELDLKVKQSPYFSRNNGPALFSNDKLRSAAFGEEVYERGNNSEVIEVDDNHLVVVRLNDRKPSMIRPLDEVTDSIRTRLTNQKARELAKQSSEEWLQQLRNGEITPQELAEREELKWQRFEKAKRNSEEGNRAIIAHAFEMAHPNGDAPIYDSMTTGPNQALVGLYEVVEPDLSEISDEERNQAADSLRTASAEAAFDAVIETLRARSDIKRMLKTEQ